MGSFLCLQGFERNLRPPSIYTADRTPPFETLFRGTSSENKLSQQEIPPSLRVFTDTPDVSALVAKLEALPCVLRVATSISGEGSSAPELKPIAGLYDIGTVVYQRPGWKGSCVLRAWSLNHPAIV